MLDALVSTCLSSELSPGSRVAADDAFDFYFWGKHTSYILSKM